jgi:hypothetical protein
VLASCVVATLGGAGSASATNICKVQGVGNPRVCPFGQSFGLPRTGTSTLSGTAVLATSGGSLNPRITCAASSITFVYDGTVRSFTPLVASRMTALSYSSCTSVPAGCSNRAVVTGLPVSYSVNWIPNSDTATLTGGWPRVTFTCPAGGTPVTCEFSGSSVTGILTGGAPPRISYANAPLGVAGFGCPATATMSANYSDVTLPAMWPTDT